MYSSASNGTVKCDRIWENPVYNEIYDFLVSYIFDKLYHRANPRSSFRATVHFVVEIQRFVCDRATPPIIEKLQPKGVAMHAYGISAYYAWTWAEPFEMNVKIEQELNFVVDDSRLFLDAQEAKKVSERTVVDEFSCI